MASSDEAVDAALTPSRSEKYVSDRQVIRFIANSKRERLRIRRKAGSRCPIQTTSQAAKDCPAATVSLIHESQRHDGIKESCVRDSIKDFLVALGSKMNSVSSV